MGEELEIVGQMTDSDLLDDLIDRGGHVAPPPGYITVDTYIERVKERGGEVGRNSALLMLRRQMDVGELAGCKMNVGGRQRWVFWPVS